MTSPRRIARLAISTITLTLALAACGDPAQPLAASTTPTSPAPSTSDPASPADDGITVTGQLDVLMAMTTPDSVPPREPSYALLVTWPGDPAAHVYPVAPDGTFGLALPPGDYRMTGLEVRSADLGRDPVWLPMLAKQELVVHAPAHHCVWGGEIHVVYGRLPAVSEAEQDALVGRAAANNHEDYSSIYRPDGGFVLAGATVDLLTSTDRPPASRACPADEFTWAAAP